MSSREMIPYKCAECGAPLREADVIRDYGTCPNCGVPWKVVPRYKGPEIPEFTNINSFNSYIYRDSAANISTGVASTAFVGTFGGTL